LPRFQIIQIDGYQIRTVNIKRRLFYRHPIPDLSWKGVHLQARSVRYIEGYEAGWYPEGL